MRPVWFIALIFGGVAAVVAASKWMTPAERVPWRSDLPAAQADARRDGKPVLLYFTAEWCGPCQAMRRNVWTEQSVADALRSFIPVRLDVDREPDLARQYNIRAMPTFLILDSQGQTTRRVEGAMGARQFADWVSRDGAGG